MVCPGSFIIKSTVTLFVSSYRKLCWKICIRLYPIMCPFFDLCIQQNPAYSNQTHSHLLLEAQVVLVVPVHEYKTDEIQCGHEDTFCTSIKQHKQVFERVNVCFVTCYTDGILPEQRSSESLPK